MIGEGQLISGVAVAGMNRRQAQEGQSQMVEAVPDFLTEPNNGLRGKSATNSSAGLEIAGSEATGRILSSRSTVTVVVMQGANFQCGHGGVGKGLA